MTSTTQDNAEYLDTVSKEYSSLVKSNCEKALSYFRKIVRNYFLFQFSFIALALIEIAVFFVLLSTAKESTFIAIMIALIILTVFCYAMLLFYFQAKKPEQLEELKNSFLSACEKALPQSFSATSQSLAIAHAAFELAGSLQHKDLQNSYRFEAFPSISIVFKKLAFYWHWKDMQHMKEMLLQLSISKHLHLLRTDPLDLSLHASLANAYLALSRIYKSSLKYSSLFQDSEDRKKLGIATNHKLRKTLRRACEEYMIITETLPNDLWAHSQLALCYRELEDYEAEILQYEKLVSLDSENNDTLIRLGLLYFAQGYHKKGLTIYQQLIDRGYPKASLLIESFIEKAQEFTDIN